MAAENKDVRTTRRDYVKPMIRYNFSFGLNWAKGNERKWNNRPSYRIR